MQEYSSELDPSYLNSKVDGVLSLQPRALFVDFAASLLLIASCLDFSALECKATKVALGSGEFFSRPGMAASMSFLGGILRTRSGI